MRKDQKNLTVFSLLKKMTGKRNIEINNTQHDFGILVESINGFKNGKDNKYWQYWVNGKIGDVSADRKIIKPTDKVEWKFEVPPELRR